MNTINIVRESDPRQRAEKQAACQQLADVLLRGCLGNGQRERIQPVYENLVGYAGKLISLASEIATSSRDSNPPLLVAQELAVIDGDDNQTDAALQCVLRKLSTPETMSGLAVSDFDGQPVGISSWEINIFNVAMNVYRSRALTDGSAPVYFTVENINNHIQ